MAKKPEATTGPAWIPSPPGWWIARRDSSSGRWRDLPVLGWDDFGAFGYYEGVAFRPAAPELVFHESTRYVHPREYPGP